MAQSSKYARLDQDVLLEFIYHDQNVSTLVNYQIEIDDNGSHVKALNTTASASDSRHLIHELGANVVNFDVTEASDRLVIENFANRTLTLQAGKTYKFDVSALINPLDFTINDSGFVPSTTVAIYNPTANGTFAYSSPLLLGGIITVQSNANPLYATADEETGNDIKTGSGTVERYHAVLVDDINGSRYALLDSTNNFIDNNLTWTGSTSSTIDQADAVDIPSNTITYDTVRLHLRSGYNFAGRGLQGFLFQVGVPRVSGVISYYTSIVYLNSSSFEIQNPTPFIIGETLYSKFIEIKVPALTDMDPNFATWFFGTGVDAVDPLGNYEITFKHIQSVEDLGGFDYINTVDEVSLTLAKEDEFNDIAANLIPAPDGDYFQLYATRNGSITAFDSYIANRIQNLGDDITVFHDITVYEQITSYWDITYNMSIVQVENFDVPIPFRPVIQNASNAISYNIDYVIRIYNEKDNTQIVKRASYTSFETGKYGKKLARINLPSSNKILKVYNTMPNILENRQITQNLATLPNNQTRFVPTFIERMNIVTGSTSVTVSQNEVVDNSTITYYSDGNSQLTLSPFDNYIKFKVAKQDGNDLISISLEGADKVVLDLAGVSIDNNMNYDDVDLSDGEIMFKISQENAQKAKNAIANSSDNVYMLSIQNGSDKTMIHHGKYTVLGASANTTVSAPIQATKQNITSAL
jgi:hypothetical protein